MKFAQDDLKEISLLIKQISGFVAICRVPIF
jgi:hypothetical protein